jgi:hypothetical protein
VRKKLYCDGARPPFDPRQTDQGEDTEVVNADFCINAGSKIVVMILLGGVLPAL